MTTSNTTVDLRSGEADVAIRAGRGDWPGHKVHKLIESDFTPMASPECIAKFERDLGRELTPADLPGLPLIGPQDEWWTLWFKDAGVELDAHRPRGGTLDRRLMRACGDGRAGAGVADALLWRGDLAGAA